MKTRGHPANFQEELKAIGGRIKERRKALKLTQRHVSKHSDISYRYYQSIEAGKINFTISTVMKIAEVLQCAASSLMSEPPKPAYNPFNSTPSGNGGPYNFKC